jgi:SAM-dependent methyltransferase
MPLISGAENADMPDRKTHWENIYENKSPFEVSWHQEEPLLSLQLIRNTRLALNAPIIDVGGGASMLVDKLCDEGYTNIGVLDVSANALAHAKDRLADKASGVEWYEEDVTEFKPPQQFSLWHDRAVFHFLTAKADRDKYVKVLKRALQPGGHLIIMAFAIGGPKKCSGLDIVQYDAKKLMTELGQGFELVESGHEVHLTPSGGEQKFAYFHFRRSTCD